jgi:hypothetical protein
MSVILPSSLDIDYLAELLSLSPLAILDTTYQAEIIRIVRMDILHPYHLAHTFSFQVCPVCIAENRMLRREVVLPYLQFCSEHNVAFVKSCQCGATLRLFKKQTQPFTCYNCGSDWSKLSRVQASLEQIKLNQSILSWYSFFFSQATLMMISMVLELVGQYPIKRKLIDQEDLAKLRQHRKSPKQHQNFTPSLSPLGEVHACPFLPPLSIVVALLVERDFFVDESMAWRLTSRTISSTKFLHHVIDDPRICESFVNLAEVSNSPDQACYPNSSPTVPFTMDRLTNASLVFSVQELAIRLQSLVDEEKPQRIAYPLAPMLTVAALAKLAKANRVDGVADWNKTEFMDFNFLMAFTIPTMIYSQMWSQVSAQATDTQWLKDLLVQFFQDQLLTAVVPARGSILLVLHGMSLGWRIPLHEREAAYLPERGMMFAKGSNEEKVNDIVVVLPLLVEIGLQGMVVTGDVMIAGLGMSTCIVQANGDYLWYIYPNHCMVYREIKSLFTTLPTLQGPVELRLYLETVQQAQRGYDSFEVWQITVTSGLPCYEGWTHLAQTFKVEQQVINNFGQTRYDVCYGITSLPAAVADARQLLSLVRRGWKH